MEAVGAAASILAIAGAGIQISTKLIAFADQVGTAPKRIQDVGTDVSVTAGTLQELGELMKDTTTKESAAMFKHGQVQHIWDCSSRCQDIFNDLKYILGRASQQLRQVYKSTNNNHDTSPKIKLSKMERLKWPFLQPSMEPLQSALRDAKSTLTLILQVVHLRHAHTTAGLDREEQNDLVRIIAAMRRQQLASADGDKGGPKALDVSDTEHSDTEDSSEVRTSLEAWSVIPNTLSDLASQPFRITPIPISQQQIAEPLSTSPQNLYEVASMMDSLSTPELYAIVEEVLNARCLGSDQSSILSITSQSWTGSHDLFGRVSGRKFKVIVERKFGISQSSRRNMQYKTRERQNIDEMHHYHENASPAPSTPNFERRRPVSENDWKRQQELEERKRLEEMNFRKEEKTKKGNSTSQPWAERQAANELSDDDLVKSLLTQYTNYDPGEPLVQVFATPPPAYDEPRAIPERKSRPY